MSIDNDKGIVRTSVDNAFDFETLESIVIRVKATEIGTDEQQSGTAEIIINVEDVNDETPNILIVRTTIKIFKFVIIAFVSFSFLLNRRTINLKLKKTNRTILTYT